MVSTLAVIFLMLVFFRAFEDFAMKHIESIAGKPPMTRMTFLTLRYR